jgi:hypothetical protein
MSHFENLRNILRTGALLSQEELESKKIKPRSIANEEVQNLRKRVYVWDFSEKRYRSLHSYVPFYFTTRTPMLRNQRDSGIQNKIVIFEVSRAFLTDQRVLFTDGNASMQQLSKSAGEEVRIIPATVSRDTCQRQYLPDGRPYGTNPNRSDFYRDVVFLDRVNWDVINRLHSVDFEVYKRVTHAEILVPDRFPLDEMLSIAVSTNEMVAAINALFAELGIVQQGDPPVVSKPGLFL